MPDRSSLTTSDSVVTTISLGRSGAREKLHFEETMLETAQVSSTVLRFITAAKSVANSSSSTTSNINNVNNNNSNNSSSDKDIWDSPDSASATKFLSPVKIELGSSTTDDDPSFDSLVSGGNGGHQTQQHQEFAELKPMAYDFSTSNVDDEPQTVLSKELTSPDVTSTESTSPQNPQSSSSSSTSPVNGITKLETLDFTASQDAFDDLASIVGISMGADSTVPSLESDLDLDAWIENTAQNIKPLVGAETIIPISQRNNGNSIYHQLHHHHHQQQQHTYLNQQHMGPVHGSSSTLQNLLQGNLNPGPPPQGCKATQLQQRETHLQQHPPPYSILQNRLQHGTAAGPPISVQSNNVVKVDSTFDLMKIASAAAAAAVSGNDVPTGNTSPYYSDSLPHSTQQTGLSGHVSTSGNGSDPAGLHRRLGVVDQLGGLAKLKAKQSNKMRQTKLMGGMNGSNGPGGAGSGQSDQQGKKMMHHCQICNRGFLNKSNIKVHLRTHTGEKPFKCEHCSKAFRQKAHLLKHMSIHKRISRD